MHQMVRTRCTAGASMVKGGPIDGALCFEALRIVRPCTAPTLYTRCLFGRVYFIDRAWVVQKWFVAGSYMVHKLLRHCPDMVRTFGTGRPYMILHI